MQITGHTLSVFIYAISYINKLKFYWYMSSFIYHWGHISHKNKLLLVIYFWGIFFTSHLFIFSRIYCALIFWRPYCILYLSFFICLYLKMPILFISLAFIIFIGNIVGNLYSIISYCIILLYIIYLFSIWFVMCWYTNCIPGIRQFRPYLSK